jgi:hypothetical protein
VTGTQEVRPPGRALADHLPDRPRSGDSGARPLRGRHPEDRSADQKYLTGGAYPVPVHKLPTINLAENPVVEVRADQRAHPADAELATGRQGAGQTLPGVHQQIPFLYFNNLDAPHTDAAPPPRCKRCSPRWAIAV